MCTPTKGKPLEKFVNERNGKHRLELLNAPKHSTFRKHIAADAVSNHKNYRRHLIFENCSTDDSDSDIFATPHPQARPKKNKILKSRSKFDNVYRTDSNDSGLFSTPESRGSPVFFATPTDRFFRQLSPPITDSSDSDTPLLDFPEPPRKGRGRRSQTVMRRALSGMGVNLPYNDETRKEKTQPIKRKRDLCTDEPENKLVATPQRRGRNKEVVEKIPSVHMGTPRRQYTFRKRPSASNQLGPTEEFSLNIEYEEQVEQSSKIIAENNEQRIYLQNYDKTNYNWAVQIGYNSACDENSCIEDISSVGEDDMEALCI